MVLRIDKWINDWGWTTDLQGRVIASGQVQYSTYGTSKAPLETSSVGICFGKYYRGTLKFGFPNSDSGIRRSGTSRTYDNRVEHTLQSIVPLPLRHTPSLFTIYSRILVAVILSIQWQTIT